MKIIISIRISAQKNPKSILKLSLNHVKLCVKLQTDYKDRAHNYGSLECLVDIWISFDHQVL